MTTTRFPIRLDPIPGEAFDSWIDAYAQRLLMPGRDLASALGVSDNLVRLRGCNVAKGDPNLDSEQIARRACEIDPAAVRGLWFGLARYDRLISEHVARAASCPGAIGWFARVLRPMTSSRWCPSCLNENGGRWLISWRLPWHLACPTHQTMLASACAACGSPQRLAGLRATYVPELLRSCTCPTAGHSGHLDRRCRYDLTIATAPTAAPAALIALQAEMAAILDPAINDDHALALIDRLVDLLIIATRVGLELGAIDRDRRNMQSILAGPLAEAHAALSEPAGEAMRAIATNDPARHPGALPQVWDGVSPELAAIVLQHRDERLGPTERLRYRSMTPTARRPEGIDLSTRVRAVPLALWPDWSIRLRPPTIAPETFRTAAAIALCVPGSTVALRAIREFWPGPRNRQRMVIFGRLITADPHGNAILAALCALAEHLDRTGAPIDYQRRQQLASNIELLDHRSWRVMCRAGGTPAGGPPKFAHARLWVWEALTGALPRHAPPSLRLPTPEFLRNHHRFTLSLPAETANRLDQHARALLDTHGCANEPITWTPSADGIAVDQLPGSDPDAIDPGAVHDAIDNQPTLQHAANQLGITIEHLRYVVRNHPRELHDPTAATAPARVRFAAQLGPQHLQQLLDQGNSLRQLEASHRIARRTLRDELIAHDLPVPPKNRHRSLQRRQPTECPSIPDQRNPTRAVNVHQ
jgi:hypothetical protein